MIVGYMRHGAGASKIRSSPLFCEWEIDSDDYTLPGLKLRFIIDPVGWTAEERIYQLVLCLMLLAYYPV